MSPGSDTMARHASMSALAHGVGTPVAGGAGDVAAAVAMVLALPVDGC